MPVYGDAAYGGESVTIENPHMRVEVHKRPTGWGWAEIFAPSGRMMAVLEHFGEAKIPGLDVPLRMEAGEYQLEDTSDGRRLTFPVKLTTLNEMVAASEFKRFVKSPLNETALAGTAAITLAADRPLMRVEYRFGLLTDLGVSYLRGPWLKAGADSFAGFSTPGRCGWRRILSRSASR